MSKSERAGILVVAAVGGVLVGWVLRSTTPAVDRTSGNAARPDAGGSSGPTVEVASRVQAPGHVERAVVDVEEAAAEAQPTVGDAFAVLEPAIGSGPGVPLGAEDFELRYQGATDGEILVAHMAIGSKLERERARIAEELMATGQYTETLQFAGDPSPFPRTSSDRPMTSFAFHIEPGDGFNKVRTAEIGPGHPEYQALEQEYYWLANQVVKLKKAQ